MNMKNTKRFTEEDANEIRKLWCKGLSLREIGKRYNCDHGLIGRVVRKEGPYKET